MSDVLDHLHGNLRRISNRRVHGRVAAVQGMLVEVEGLQGHLSIGDRCRIAARGQRLVVCECIGFRDRRALVMPYQALEGVALGARAEALPAEPAVRPTDAWLGRVVNAFGEPVDGGAPLPQGDEAVPIRSAPPSAHARNRIEGKIDLGVRVLNTFTTCCRGQRMGIFAGSGVGKSILMSMMARFSEAQVIVIGLIGERGREVQEFIQDELGEEGLARSVVVVATSDESALMRREAAHLTLAVAEYYRDRGLDVLCLMDSVTRFAMAQREIGLSAGEPPATKGYTPTVFAELPRLLERAGPGAGPDSGSITGLFTVLVEGDDHNEPVSDAVRGILDGHIVLDRTIAHRNRYPAVNVLRSVSRTMPDCNDAAQNRIVDRARQLLSAHDDMAELIRLGAYRRGSDPQVDEAIKYNGAIEGFIAQGKNERASLEEGYRALAEVLDMDYGAPSDPSEDVDDGGEEPD
ncbi:flagellar protein export ATPase FliI [Marivibrio halodurans]|uniref:Flagellum-specific ATP synthase n=1 Tax=Marivibrio halodurans TaxID=2039722 RepID=A0A8J7RZS5_9PROT|nr:flagellar protein export ATPase FliI [Marivibrio halodurans]MBP5856063.1 flagellar protein export ATPase FliI [Marivibrio halodurans]